MKKSQLKENRQLSDLISVGKATLNDFDLLGVHSVQDLAIKDANTLYVDLCKITQRNHDICVKDVFSAAIAQAKDPNLPLEKCQWWYWSRLRKNNDSTR